MKGGRDAVMMAAMLPRHCERSEAIHRTAWGSMDCFVASLLAMTADRPGAWRLSIRIGPLELAQQAVAAFNCLIEGGLRGLLAAEDVFELFVDHVADQHE